MTPAIFEAETETLRFTCAAVSVTWAEASRKPDQAGQVKLNLSTDS